MAGAAGAQDTTRVAALQVLTDSIRIESCRGGTISADGLRCTGARYAPRPSVILRLSNRLDSLTRGFLVPVAVESSPGNVSFAAIVYYNSLGYGFPAPGRDTVTVCAVVESQAGDRKLAWPPVLMQVSGDSSTFAPRVREPLSKTCARAITSAKLTTTDSILVRWNGDYAFLRDRKVWRPFPAVRP